MGDTTLAFTKGSGLRILNVETGDEIETNTKLSGSKRILARPADWRSSPEMSTRDEGLLLSPDYNVGSFKHPRQRRDSDIILGILQTVIAW